MFPNVSLVKAVPRQNPITGQHVELSVQTVDDQSFDKVAFGEYLKGKLQPHMIPKRISVGSIAVGHRFKRS